MILDDILVKRKEQLEREKRAFSPAAAKAAALGEKRPVRSLYKALKRDRLSVIAEVKHASPSKGLISADFQPERVAAAYEAAGADAVSVLTEEHYFQGGGHVLKALRGVVTLPLLRKDFIFDEYQLYEARVLGADAVLLIVAMLEPSRLAALAETAAGLGLECLVEAHDERELETALGCEAKIIGINNRNLKTFEVDQNITAHLAPLVPRGCVLVAESGVKTNADTRALRHSGADAVLVGETLMRSGNIVNTLAALREGI